MCLNFPALDYSKLPASLKIIYICISIYYIFKTEKMVTLKYVCLYF